MTLADYIPFGIRAQIGKILIESFYKKMGKRLGVTVHKYQEKIDIEWVFVGNHKRETILFLHGFSDRKENFYFAAKTLIRDYDIIIPDMPGFGRSTADGGLEYSLENYSYWLSEFVEKLDVERFHLVGSSLGGAVCAKLAARDPERIRSLTLVDPLGFYINGCKSMYDEALEGLNLFQVDTPDDYEKFRERIFCKKPVLPVFVREQMFKHAKDHSGWYRKIFNELADLNLIRNKEITLEEMSLNSLCKDIRMPTLIMWGRHDTLFPYETAEFIKGEIEGSKTHIFEDLGHCPHLEDPKSLARELASFIRLLA